LSLDIDISGLRTIPVLMKTILLIDDEPQVLSTLCEILTKPGYNVIPRPDAESAPSLVRGGTKVDLIITDLHLPGMNGLELIALFKKIVPSVPVIVLTGYGSVESYIQSCSSGVFEYINKPVQARELRRIVSAALSSSAISTLSCATGSLWG
jgi:DNA-binding NtrC family response regulator